MTSQYGEPRELRARVNGVELCYFEWGTAGDPELLLVHATGFHARCWDQVVAALPSGLHIIALDMRGHGRSERQPPYAWHAFGADLQALAAHLELRNPVAVGHSMGGHCVLQLAIKLPGLLRSMVLIDPVVFEPAAYPADRHRMYGSAEDHPVGRRRNHWRDWQDMRASLSGKGFFGLWDPAVFDDYCRYGCLPVADGVELACPPLVEASVYLENTATDVHAGLTSLTTPTLVLRAPPCDPDEELVMDFSKSPTWPLLAAQMPNGRDLLLPELTHFIPMQAPGLVAEHIVAALA